MSIRHQPAQGLCELGIKATPPTHPTIQMVTAQPRLDGPPRIPPPTPAWLYTTVLTSGKSPRFVGKGKADSAFSIRPLLRAFPKHSIPSGFTISQLGGSWATHPPSRTLGRRGPDLPHGPGFKVRFLVGTRDGSDCPTWLPFKAWLRLLPTPPRPLSPHLLAVFTTQEARRASELGNSRPPPSHGRQLKYN